MLPIRHQSIFRSRWIALLWAAGIIYGAYEYAAPPEGDAADPANGVVTDATGAGVDQAQVQALADTINSM